MKSYDQESLPKTTQDTAAALISCEGLRHSYGIEWNPSERELHRLATAKISQPQKGKGNVQRTSNSRGLEQHLPEPFQTDKGGFDMTQEQESELRRKVQEDMVRVSIGKGRTRQEWEQMIIDADRLYGEGYMNPGIARRVLNGILGFYGLVVLTCRHYFDFRHPRWTGV